MAIVHKTCIAAVDSLSAGLMSYQCRRWLRMQHCCDPDAAGAHTVDCNAACMADCRQRFWHRAESKAAARITGARSASVNGCNGTLLDHLQTAEQQFLVQPPWAVPLPICPEVLAQCEAFMASDAVAAAFSDAAATSNALTRSMCKLPLSAGGVDEAAVYEQAEVMAAAVAEVR